MKICTIIGARPQFIKASVVSHELSKITSLNEIIIHTGQHYDKNMSSLFFEELDIPREKYNLGVASNSHAEQTGKMLEGIEKILILDKFYFGWCISSRKIAYSCNTCGSRNALI